MPSESEGERSVLFDRMQKLHPWPEEQALAGIPGYDRHFARLWTEFAGAMRDRSVLDRRTCALVRVSQTAMLRDELLTGAAIRAALSVDAAPREVLEAILQTSVYGGLAALAPALRAFAGIVEDGGLSGELALGDLPTEGRDALRDRASEETTWDAADRDDPRREDLMARHGWLGVSRGMQLRPGHHLSVLAWHDAIDEAWAGVWLRFVYQGMYAREILDDRTRLLCMVANCVAVHEMEQARAHMQGALRVGATAREVLEVILQSSVLIGMPTTVKAMQALMAILRDEGRLAEIGDVPERG